MEKFKKWLGIGVPGGIDDIVIRSVKTGVAVFLATPFVNALLEGGAFDLNAAKAAIVAGAVAVVNAILNAALLALSKWTSS